MYAKSEDSASYDCVCAGLSKPLMFACVVIIIISCAVVFEPCCEKTGLWGFRPGPTQTGLCNHKKMPRGFKFWI